MTVGRGDYVECVDASGPFGMAYLKQGAIYCVELVNPWPEPCWHDNCGKAGLKLFGIESLDFICANRFRPIYKRDEKLIESLQAPSDVKVTENV